MKTIQISEKGDASVGIQGQTVATLSIDDSYVSAILGEEGGKQYLCEFETQLAELFERFFGSDTGIDVDDDIIPKPEWY